MINDTARHGVQQTVASLVDAFAMEFMTGHYRPLREDERQRYEQLRVVMLALVACVRQSSAAVDPQVDSTGTPSTRD